MKQSILFIFLAVLCYGTAAQQYKISGIVNDAQSGEPIPFANVVLLNMPDSSYVGGIPADVTGHFEMTKLKPGAYLVRVSMVGFQTWGQEVYVSSNLNLGRIKLSSGTTLSTVKVTAVRPIFTMDGEKNIYNTGDDPSIQNGTVVDALQNAPGIEVDAAGNITLRGTQSVDVWINGRASRMNAEALKQYIKTLPANAVKKIEVITNPSARYGGGNPIVNIVTKNKNIENQFLSLGLNANTKPELTPWVSYVFNNERWEVDAYANASLINSTIHTAESDALLTEDGTLSRTDTVRRTFHERNANSIISADVAYHFDSLNTIYAWGAFMPVWTGWTSESAITRHERIYSPGNYSFSESASKDKRTPSLGFEDGVWFEHLFDDSTGHILSVGYYGSGSWRDSTLVTSRNFTHLPQYNMVCNSHEQVEEWFHCLEAAYLRPFGKLDTVRGTFDNELETGGEVFYFSQNGTKVATIVNNDVTSGASWLSHEVLSRTVNASLYANYTRRWGRFSAKVGLRGGLQAGNYSYPDAAEHNFSFNTPTVVPSLHLTYSTPKHSTFSISYTRRMEVPEGNNYSTRRFYTLDAYSVGNPLLRVGSSHRIEAKWDKYRDGLGAVGVNLFYYAKSNQQGTLADVAIEDEVFHRLVAFSQPVNIGSSWDGGFDLHLTFRPNAYVNVRLNGSLFYDYLDLQFRPSDSPYRNGMLCGSIRLNAWVKLWEKVQLFGNIHFSSPTQNMMNTTLWRKGLDIGANADFFHRRLSVNIGVNDLFNWNKRYILSNNPYFSANSSTTYVSRYINLGVTVRFGQMELEKEPRQSGRRR